MNACLILSSASLSSRWFSKTGVWQWQSCSHSYGTPLLGMKNVISIRLIRSDAWFLMNYPLRYIIMIATFINNKWLWVLIAAGRSAVREDRNLQIHRAIVRKLIGTKRSFMQQNEAIFYLIKWLDHPGGRNHHSVMKTNRPKLTFKFPSIKFMSNFKKCYDIRNQRFK